MWELSLSEKSEDKLTGSAVCSSNNFVADKNNLFPYTIYKLPHFQYKISTANDKMSNKNKTFPTIKIS